MVFPMYQGNVLSLNPNISATLSPDNAPPPFWTECLTALGNKRPLAPSSGDLVEGWINWSVSIPEAKYALDIHVWGFERYLLELNLFALLFYNNWYIQVIAVIRIMISIVECARFPACCNTVHGKVTASLWSTTYKCYLFLLFTKFHIICRFWTLLTTAMKSTILLLVVIAMASLVCYWCYHYLLRDKT